MDVTDYLTNTDDDFYEEMDSQDVWAYDHLRSALFSLPMRPGTNRGLFKGVRL